MSWEKELLKERDLLLSEHHKFQEMKVILRIRKKNMLGCKTERDIAVLNRDTKLFLRREWRGTLFVPGVGRTGRRAYRYYQKIRTKISSLPEQVSLFGVKLKSQEIEQKMEVYINAIVKRASISGSIGEMIAEKEIPWEKVEQEIKLVLTDLTALIALLGELSHTDKDNEESRRQLLHSYGFDGGFIGGQKFENLLLARWPDTLRMIREAGDTAPELFDILKTLYQSLPESIVSWQERVETVPALAKLVKEFHYEINELTLTLKWLCGIFLCKHRLTWKQFTRDLPHLLQRMDFKTLDGALQELNRFAPFRKPQDWDNLQELLSTKGTRIKSLIDVGIFLGVLPLARDLKEPLRKLIAVLMTSNLSGISGGRADIENHIPKIKRAFQGLLSLPTSDLETKYLFRKLAALLPLGGDYQLILLIRNEAIELQRKSKNLLYGLRTKIHNSPGREDVDLVKAYIKFLHAGSIAPFRDECLSWGGSLLTPDNDEYWEKLEQNHAFLQRDTLEIAQSLLGHLSQLWQLHPVDMRETQQKLSSLKFPFPPEQEKIFQDILRRLDILANYFEKQEYSPVAKIIGSLRADVQVLMESAPVYIKTELFFFELFLENVERIIHPEVVKQIGLHSWKDVEKLLDLITQKCYSLIAAYSTDVALAQGIYYLQEFRKTKDMKDIQEALDHFMLGVNYINDKTVREFKKIFYEREHVGKKELEELVSPFYRTGPLSQFDQLLEILRIEYERGTIKAIVQHVPRPIKTQMRERLYAGV